MSLLVRASAIVGTTPGGTDFFNSTAKPFNELIGSELTVNAGAPGPLPSGIVFNNFVGNTFEYAWRGGTSGGIPYDVCDSAGRIPPQNWGPAGMAPAGDPSPYYVFADIDLGGVPDGTDLLQMQINLHRTVVPTFPPTAAIGDWPLPEITENALITCDGGSCVLEHQAGLSRQFWVELIAGRVVLRRQQSITSAATGYAGGQGYITHFLDSRTGGGQFASNTVQLGAPNQCSVTNSADYTSVYTGTLIITPCCYRGP